MSQLHMCLDGEAIEEIRDVLEWGGGILGGDHQVGGCEFGSRGFDTCDCFLLQLPSSQLSGCCRIRLGLLRPGCLPGGGHFRLLGHLCDRLRREIRIWGWSGGGLDNMPPSDDVIPPLAQVNLLVRGPGQLSFWIGGVACGGALSDTLRRSLCKVGAPTCDTLGRVSTVSLRVSKAVAALALQWALWSHVRLHRHSQSAEFGDLTHFGHLGPLRHRYNEVGVERALLGWVVVATAGTQLRDSLDTNVQGLELLLDDAVRHTPAQVLHQTPHTSVLWEHKGMETHTLPPIEGLQGADCSSEPVSSLWDHHQLLSL